MLGARVLGCYIFTTPWTRNIKTNKQQRNLMFSVLLVTYWHTCKNEANGQVECISKHVRVVYFNLA